MLNCAFKEFIYLYRSEALLTSMQTQLLLLTTLCVGLVFGESHNIVIGFLPTLNGCNFGLDGPIFKACNEVIKSLTPKMFSAPDRPCLPIDPITKKYHIQQ